MNYKDIKNQNFVSILGNTAKTKPFGNGFVGFGLAINLGSKDKPKKPLWKNCVTFDKNIAEEFISKASNSPKDSILVRIEGRMSQNEVGDKVYEQIIVEKIEFYNKLDGGQIELDSTYEISKDKPKEKANTTAKSQSTQKEVINETTAEVDDLPF
jgi:hypothetical protein